MKLNNSEIEQYHRHLILNEFGMDKQLLLKKAKVLVVGAGGLGAPVLLYLAAAGIGTIGIIDFDKVDISNLQRQVIYDHNDIGKYKVDAAKKKILAVNPNINVITFNEKLTKDNAMEIVDQFDVVADGTDNFASRYLVNDACVLTNTINVYASIFKFEGQIAVFNFKNKDGSYGPNYRDIFPSPPPPDLIPNCAEAGVIGVLPGIIGCLQANEVIKIIAEIGAPLSGKLMIFDALSLQTRILKIKKDKNNCLNGDHPTQFDLIDYEIFCNSGNDESTINTISASELKGLISDDKPFILIDVRKPFEFNVFSISDINIPSDEIRSNIDKIPKDKTVILYCKSGQRSLKAIKTLNSEFGYDKLLNLSGGIDAYIEIMDKEL